MNKTASVLKMVKNVYLCAPTNEALNEANAAAGQLNQPFYWIPCSESMHHTELLGETTPEGDFSRTSLFRAFTEGGVFCLHGVHRAPDQIQAWLKAVCDGRAHFGSQAAERHSNFALVLTSSMPIRQLWDGKVDAAFLDRFVFLKLNEGSES